MAQGKVQVPPDSTGKNIDGFELAGTGNLRQAVVIGDPSTDANTVGIGSDSLLPIKARQGADYDTGGGTVNVDLVGIALPGSGGPVGVSSSNPLPVSSSTFATSAKQDTGNTSLSSIDGKLPSLGQALAAASIPVVLTAAQITTLTPPAAITGFATEAGNLASIKSKTDNIPALGQALAAASVPVVLTSAQLITLTPPAAITGFATSALQSTINSTLGSPFQAGGSIGNTGFTAVGTIADDSTTPGNPVMVGGTAKTFDGTDPGNVSAENDVTRLITDLQRRLFVEINHPGTKHFHSDGSTALSNTSVASAPGSGFEIIISNIRFSSGAATAINMYLDDGTNKIIGPIYLEAVAGRGYCSGPICVGAGDNKAVRVTTSASIAHSVDIEYFTRKL